MGPDKFGDSYDIVKRAIVHWLACPEEWAVHPMCWGGDYDFLDDYTRFLGIGRANGNIESRRSVVRVGRACPKHLLLDPHTGLCPRHQGPIDSLWSHVTIEELAQIADGPDRASNLTLVFDQSIGHRTREAGMEIVKEHLQTLRSDHKVHGAAYVSHAAFLWASKDKDLLDRATKQLLDRSGLPLDRFVDDGCGRNHIGA